MASFYIQKHRSTGWTLMEQSYLDGKSIQKSVPREVYSNLGINPDWSIETARNRCREINKQEKFKRKEAHKVSATAQRALDLELATSIYVPEEIIAAFYGELTGASFGSEKHLKRLHSHFKTTCKILNTLRLEPHDYENNKERFYRYFLEAEYSLDYTNKLIRSINKLGWFISKHKGLFYSPLSAPNSFIRNKIDDTYQDSEGYIGESDPLTPDLLEIASKTLPEPQGRWVYISLWFGLRPSEIDNLSHPGSYKVEITQGTKVLWVYQSKLTSLPKPKRWKKIPILYPEQEKALEFITLGLKRPTRKRLDEIFPKLFITTYAGRKGFMDLMVEKKGQPLEAVSAWMGHQDISITWRKYRDKTSVFLGKKSG